MINNDNENSSTSTVTTNQLEIESSSSTGNESNAESTSFPPPSLTNEPGDDQTVQIKSNDQGEFVDDDEFIRITAAHQILTEAQTYDEQKNYAAALHLYRICVDLLLEELMFTEGTEQSRVYLREKCTAIMDHIDFLKSKLEPIPVEPTPTENTETTTNPPTDELNSLHLA